LEFPVRNRPHAGRSVAPLLAWLRLGRGVDQWAGAIALAHASQLYLDYPPLIRIRNREAAFAKLPGPLGILLPPSKFHITLLETDDREPLDEKKVDLILAASPDFFTRLEQDERQEFPPRPFLQMLTRPDDDRSRQASQRLGPILDNWDRELRKVRLARKGLLPSFDRPFDLFDEEANR